MVRWHGISEGTAFLVGASKTSPIVRQWRAQMCQEPAVSGRLSGAFYLAADRLQHPRGIAIRRCSVCGAKKDESDRKSREARRQGTDLGTTDLHCLYHRPQINMQSNLTCVSTAGKLACALHTSKPSEHRSRGAEGSTSELENSMKNLQPPREPPACPHLLLPVFDPSVRPLSPCLPPLFFMGCSNEMRGRLCMLCGCVLKLK